jgi:CBS domain-containing protein
MEMKRALDLMVPLDAFPYIPYWFTLRQALAEMETARSQRDPGRALPWIILVFSAQNQLLGLVQRKDVLAGLRPGRANKHRDRFPVSDVTEDLNLYRLSFSPEKATQEFAAQLDRQIIEFMTPIHATVEANEYILLALYLMMDRNLAFVPVVQAGSIVGILYTEDALHEIIDSIVV